MIQASLSVQDITDPRFRTICEKILAKMDELHVPGVAVGILCDGIEYTAGLGITSIDNPLPVTSNTLFEIGSTTKTITGVAVMRLVEQGKIDLDAPLCIYLPDLKLSNPDLSQKATMRHLLTHTGGWLGDHFPDCGFNDDAVAKYVATLADVPMIAPFGEVFSYCNSGFVLAGRVIEVVTGKMYEQAIRELVLEPIGLKDSFFFMHEVMHKRFATGHHNESETNKLTIADFWPVPRFAAPAGGLISTVHDQLKYARFLMDDGTADDGTRILKTETIEMMRSPQAKAGGGLGDWIGLSLMLRDLNGIRIVFHGGSINGQQSDFQTVPEKKFAFTLLTNADMGVIMNLQVAPFIYETYLGLKAPEYPFEQINPEQAAEYTGVYKKADGLTTTITTDDQGQVIINMLPESDPQAEEKPKPEIYVTKFIGDDKLLIMNPPAAGMKCDFVRDMNNKVRWFRESGRISEKV